MKTKWLILVGVPMAYSLAQASPFPDSVDQSAFDEVADVLPNVRQYARAVRPAAGPAGVNEDGRASLIVVSNPPPSSGPSDPIPRGALLYQQDFEGLLTDEGFPPNSVSDDGWRVFGNVYTNIGDTVPIGFYGTFLAPNGSPSQGFCAVVDDDQGGDTQGDKQFSVFNDYGNTTAHLAGQYVEALVFQERTIVADDIGKTMRLSFDAKKGLIAAPTIAAAYFKTLDAGFNTTNFVELDMTSVSDVWDRYEVVLDLTDPALEGQLLQFGFSSRTTNFEPSSIFYDNIELTAIGDLDDDGIEDSGDNCSTMPNPDQRDTDGDNIGNACDADLNNDCTVNFEDLGLMNAVFFTADADADLNGDGFVNFIDLGIMKRGFFATPGPSGLNNPCNAVN